VNHIGFAIWWPKSTGTGGRWSWEEALDAGLSKPIRQRIQHEIEWPISGAGQPPGAVHTVIDQHPLHKHFPHKQHPHQLTVLTPTMRPKLRWQVMLRGLHEYKDELKCRIKSPFNQPSTKLIWHELSLPIISPCLDVRFAQNHLN
jgi:hypothetical protein